MKDLTRRLSGAPEEVVVEMICRECFPYEELVALHKKLAAVGAKQDLCAAIANYLHGGRLGAQPAWLAALANADRQLAIHAVLNAGMSDDELARFEKLLKLQADGHLLRQLRVAIELEQNRRRIGGKRGSGNRVTTRRG
ncbi:MAG: hypothetical protein KGL39_44570 [Patescibacteria group bacterium]|nr:hypothetical protein [Patescibacteria group bacterium]